MFKHTGTVSFDVHLKNLKNTALKNLAEACFACSVEAKFPAESTPAVVMIKMAPVWISLFKKMAKPYEMLYRSPGIYDPDVKDGPLVPIYASMEDDVADKVSAEAQAIWDRIREKSMFDDGFGMEDGG